MHGANDARMSRAAQACTQQAVMRTTSPWNKHDVRAAARGWSTHGIATASHCQARHRSRPATWLASSESELHGHLPGRKHGPPGGPRMRTTIWSQRFGHAQCVTKALVPNSGLVFGTRSRFTSSARSSRSAPCGMWRHTSCRTAHSEQAATDTQHLFDYILGLHECAMGRCSKHSY